MAEHPKPNPDLIHQRRMTKNAGLARGKTISTKRILPEVKPPPEK